VVVAVVLEGGVRGTPVLSVEIGSGEREGQARPCRREDRVQDRLLIHARVLNISATYLWPILTSRERLPLPLAFRDPRCC